MSILLAESRSKLRVDYAAVFHYSPHAYSFAVSYIYIYIYIDIDIGFAYISVIL